MELRDIIKETPLIGEDATFTEVLKTMVREQTNSLLVINSDGELSGEVGVPDLLDAIVPEYLDGDSIAAEFATEEMFEEAVRATSEKPVREFMSVEVDPIQADDSLMTVAATAIAHQRARIPVVDHDNRPIGMVSRRGLKHILAKFLNITDSA